MTRVLVSSLLELRLKFIFGRDFKVDNETIELGGRYSTAVVLKLRAPAAQVRFVASLDFFGGKNSRDSMTAVLLRWWTAPRLNVVIRSHPVLVRAVLQKKWRRDLSDRSGLLATNGSIIGLDYSLEEW